MAKRHIMRIELTSSAKNALSTVSTKTGMTQVSIMSKTAVWFSRQPEVIQAAVLGRYPAELETDIARLVLERMGR